MSEGNTIASCPDCDSGHEGAVIWQCSRCGEKWYGDGELAGEKLLFYTEDKKRRRNKLRLEIHNALQAENESLRGKVSRLEKRGICDMQHEIKSLGTRIEELESICEYAASATEKNYKQFKEVEAELKAALPKEVKK